MSGNPLIDSNDAPAPLAPASTPLPSHEVAEADSPLPMHSTPSETAALTPEASVDTGPHPSGLDLHPGETTLCDLCLAAQITKGKQGREPCYWSRERACWHCKNKKVGCKVVGKDRKECSIRPPSVPLGVSQRDDSTTGFRVYGRPPTGVLSNAGLKRAAEPSDEEPSESSRVDSHRNKKRKLTARRISERRYATESIAARMANCFDAPETLVRDIFGSVSNDIVQRLSMQFGEVNARLDEMKLMMASMTGTLEAITQQKLVVCIPKCKTKKLATVNDHTGGSQGTDARLGIRATSVSRAPVGGPERSDSGHG